MSALLARAWMRHWTKHGQPVRWVVRHNDRLIGFADEAELCAFLDAVGQEEALDLHKGTHNAGHKAHQQPDPPSDTV